MYALIDCNNFFVSCERLFRPELNGRPVVVLSSNDGCAVSRSQEAKDLGVPMGAPHFQWREFFKQHGVVTFSANFELYGDISQRIVTLLTTVTPHIEVYSVDESFLDLTKLNITDYSAWGRAVRDSILKNVGVPVSVGIAPTKTLCKAANHYAKKHPETGGVTCLKADPDTLPVISTEAEGEMEKSSQNTRRSLDYARDDRAFTRVLAATPVEDVWGVGWRLTPKLKAEGIHTALDLARLSPKRAQQLMGIHGRQMVYELNGTRCLPLQQEHKAQQMVMRGRQFGEDTSEFYVVESAVASLAARAAASLRRENLLARRAVVILRTNRHRPGYQHLETTVRFYTPTADTGLITSQLVRLLTSNFNARLSYHKADVLLYDLVPAGSLQTDLIGTVNLAEHRTSEAKMAAFDHINHKYGKGTLKMASEALTRAWEPRKRLSSPHYTSAWSDLPEVKLV